MKSPLRILYLEDDPGDAELVQETLAVEDIACQVTRVETETDFISSLRESGFDLIFADYTLPSFDGLSALKIARQHSPSVPFIFVSGTLGEEVAIEALKVGATDYVFKTRLSRIVPSVRRALREAEERIELSRSEEALRRSEVYLTEAQKLSHTGSFGWDVRSGEIYWSRESFRIFGCEPTVRPTVELADRDDHLAGALKGAWTVELGRRFSGGRGSAGSSNDAGVRGVPGGVLPLLGGDLRSEGRQHRDDTAAGHPGVSVTSIG